MCCVSDAGQKPPGTPAGTEVWEGTAGPAGPAEGGYGAQAQAAGAIGGHPAPLCNHHKPDRTYHGLRHRRSILAQTGTSRAKAKPQMLCWVWVVQQPAAHSSTQQQQQQHEQPAAAAAGRSRRGGGEIRRYEAKEEQKEGGRGAAVNQAGGERGRTEKEEKTARAHNLRA